MAAATATFAALDGTAPPPFPEPPASLAEFEEKRPALEPPDLRGVGPAELIQLAQDADQLLARIARGQGAVDVAMSEGLAALDEGDRLAVLCYSSLGDYAREALGIAESTAKKLARLGRELRSRPLLRAAARSGEVTVRRVQAILPVALGDGEAAWVERARADPVRVLERDVRKLSALADEDEVWRRLHLHLDPQRRARVDAGLEVMGRVLGATSTRWQRLEAMAQEYLGSHPVEAPDGLLPAVFRPAGSRLDALAARLEAETERWAALPEPAPQPAPGDDLAGEADPARLDWRLRELAAMRLRWDAAVGWLGLLVRRARIYRLLGFASFKQYCEERLGLAVRTVQQRIALEERLWELPALRQAMNDGLSYEKARLVARCPDDQVEAAIAQAREKTCIQLRRSLAADQDAQMRARRVFTTLVPDRVALTLAHAFEAVRAAEGRTLSGAECLARIADETVAIYQLARKRRKTRSMRIRERDHGLCLVPGCSRAADDAHHRRFRSHGGRNEGENLVSICSFHHLRCVHTGRLSVVGRAPGGLLWFHGRPRVK